MNVVQYKTKQDVAEHVANLIANTIDTQKAPVFILASGGTPTDALDVVTTKLTSGLQTANTTIIKLDEWVGLGADNIDSCEHYLQSHVIQPWGIASENFISFNGSAKPSDEIERVEQQLSTIPRPDICVLGLGINGHIGFIEPGESLIFESRCIDLHPDSKNHPMVAGKYDVEHGVSLGLKHIFNAKKVVLMVTGEHKKQIFKRLMVEDITTQLPATMLKLHPNVEVVIDESVAN